MSDVVEWCGQRVKICDVYFEPMNLGSGELGIRLLVPEIAADQIEHARAALEEAIRKMPANRELVQIIRTIEVARLTASPDRYIALENLVSFIRWWQARRRHPRPRCVCRRS